MKPVKLQSALVTVFYCYCVFCVFQLFVQLIILVKIYHLFNNLLTLTDKVPCDDAFDWVRHGTSLLLGIMQRGVCYCWQFCRVLLEAELAKEETDLIDDLIGNRSRKELKRLAEYWRRWSIFVKPAEQWGQFVKTAEYTGLEKYMLWVDVLKLLFLKSTLILQPSNILVFQFRHKVFPLGAAEPKL